jgi:hypothetical protein
LGDILAEMEERNIDRLTFELKSTGEVFGGLVLVVGPSASAVINAVELHAGQPV